MRLIMDKIEKQIEELTNYGKGRKGEISEICIKAANTIKQLYEETVDAPTIDAGWIPCSERLPEVGKDVLFCDSEWSEEGCLRADGDWWQFRWSTVMPKEKVTAWMPLPKPYREDGE